MSRRTRLLPLLAMAALVATSHSTPAGANGFEPSAWIAETPEQPKALLIQGATIWTSGPEGRLENADLLIRDGKIAKVGTGLSAPRGAMVIDAAGRHVTAGLIDCHSHVAIAGGTNEGSNTTTAEVRIQDVIAPDDVNLYRQLAGGVTSANVLHGSANAIGGQNAVIKFRWGATADAMMFEGAPAGIKFALGENPKQSNWGGLSEVRYPQTRPGVEQAIRERFLAAKDYQRRRNRYRTGSPRRSAAPEVPPRRDLQLEALVEILEGKRLVHSHSYRADEILMLIRLAEELGFRVSSFQHVLEGYKVADEIAAHGAGASTFSDWWAYKFEVIDAIPYNGAIMHERGVVVSFNSDDSELARRLNLEAAKAVRYGGVEESEALRFVTLNPAIQLGIDDQVGSLEAGKDADFVLWSGDPLSSRSRVEQTWIDGRKYFDRQADLDHRAALTEERAMLLAKLKAEAEAGSDSEEDEASGEGSQEGPTEDPEGTTAEPKPEGDPPEVEEESPPNSFQRGSESLRVFLTNANREDR